MPVNHRFGMFFWGLTVVLPVFELWAQDRPLVFWGAGGLGRFSDGGRGRATGSGRGDSAGFDSWRVSGGVAWSAGGRFVVAF